jgi:phosphoenolpyruvate carboxylase
VPAEKRTTTSPQSARDSLRSEEKEITTPNVNDEDSYRQLIKKIDDQLKELRSRYATETRGNAGSEPFLFTTEEAFRGHQEDLLSRLRDAQYKAQGLLAGVDAQSPPFSTNPPPAYSEKQKLLSSLRNQIHELESERERVIAEMKRRDMDTRSLSSE